MSHTKIFIKEELKLVNKQMNEKKSNIENKMLEKEPQLWKQELVNKIKLIEPDASKICGKNKDNINVTNWILILTCHLLVQDWPMEQLIAVAVHQIHQSVKRSETVQCCRPILSTPQISEDYNQTRTLDKV